MKVLKQCVRVGCAALAFAGFGIGGALLSLLLLPLASLWGGRFERRIRCQRLVRASFRLFHGYMRWTGLVDFDPARFESPVGAQPAVVIANHPTLVDVSALVAAYGPMCTVVKPSLFRNPLLGPLLRLCGHVRAGDGGLGNGEHFLIEAKQRLRDGHTVLMFPEGTRSGRRGMRRFRAGAFKLAHEVGVPLLPVVVTADPPGLRKGQPWYDIPARAIRLRLEPLAPIQPAGYGSPRRLQDDVRRRFESALCEEGTSPPRYGQGSRTSAA